MHATSRRYEGVEMARTTTGKVVAQSHGLVAVH